MRGLLFSYTLFWKKAGEMKKRRPMSEKLKKNYKDSDPKVSDIQRLKKIGFLRILLNVVLKTSNFQTPI